MHRNIVGQGEFFAIALKEKDCLGTQRKIERNCQFQDGTLSDNSQLLSVTFFCDKKLHHIYNTITVCATAYDIWDLWKHWLCRIEERTVSLASNSVGNTGSAVGLKLVQ